jgi:hypothetical protein
VKLTERTQLVRSLVSLVFLISLVLLIIAWFYFSFIMPLPGIAFVIDYFMIGILISWAIFYFPKSREKK